MDKKEQIDLARQLCRNIMYWTGWKISSAIKWEDIKHSTNQLVHTYSEFLFNVCSFYHFWRHYVLHRQIKHNMNKWPTHIQLWRKHNYYNNMEPSTKTYAWTDWFVGWKMGPIYFISLCIFLPMRTAPHDQSTWL